ncbi:MAG: AzlC family ABC transporter permease [Thermoactinomyces sp.]|jgi:4-azaleucine resistance transporter AzlC
MRSSQLAPFLLGAKKSTPIVIGYIPIAIAFGVLARQSHLPLYSTLLMSIIVFAGASQFMAVNMLATGAASIEIIIATFILNLRHMIMSLSLMNLLSRIPTGWKTLLSFGITDESFAVATLESTKEPDIANQYFILGLFASAYSSWVLGTAVGAILYTWIPPTISDSMSVALYAMFIGLLIPAVKAAWRRGIIAAISIALCSLFYWKFQLSMGWSIVFATIIGSMAGIWIREEETA